MSTLTINKYAPLNTEPGLLSTYIKTRLIPSRSLIAASDIIYDYTRWAEAQGITYVDLVNFHERFTTHIDLPQRLHLVHVITRRSLTRPGFSWEVPALPRLRRIPAYSGIRFRTEHDNYHW